MNESGQRLEKYLQYSFEKGYFNGNWIFSERGHIISKGSMGIAHPYRKNLLNENAVFEMASVSKQFTAAAIMVLGEQGKIKLNDSFHKYFPDNPYSKNITIEHLLNHTSGLPDYMDWLKNKGQKDKKIYPNSIMETFLNESDLPPMFLPGDKWDYCNTAYALLALIVEKASDKNFTDFMNEYIFIPCDMKNSCVYHRRMNGDTIDNYAFGMVFDEGEYKLPDDTEEFNYVIPLDGIEGDGIINTTIEDMYKWDIALRKGTVLSLEAQRKMYTPAKTNDGETYPYGYGWQIEEDKDAGRIVNHGGGWPGYNTMFIRLLDKEVMLALMTNQTGCNGNARSELLDGLLEIACGRQADLP